MHIQDEGKGGGLRARGAAMLVAATLALAALTPPLRAEVPRVKAWNLVFSDDFNGAAGQLPSDRRWIFDLGHGYPGGGPNWGTREIESYTANPRNIHLDGKGHLRIVALRDADGLWTSARIETRRDDFRAPAHGELRIQARLRLPDVHGDRALGYWPAFWTLPGSFRRDMNWPADGEVDIMENVNGIDRVWGTLHCGVVPGGPCHEKEGLSAQRPCPGSACQAAFHTYTFEWDRSTRPEQLRWYVDGQLYHTLRRTDLPAATWDRMTIGQGMFVLFNLAMGGEFPDRLAAPLRTPTGATEPGHALIVDYVAVWTRPSGQADTARP